MIHRNKKVTEVIECDVQYVTYSNVSESMECDVTCMRVTFSNSSSAELHSSK